MLPRLEYPAHYEMRLVIDNVVWEVYFGPFKLGRLIEEHMHIGDQFGKLKRVNR